MWRGHPFRLMLGSYGGKGALCIGLLTLIAATSHAGGVPVYGTQLAGITALGVLLLLALGAGLSWRFHLAPLMRRYEQRYPEVLNPASGEVRIASPVRLESPMWFMLAVGVGFYLAFIWHPWNHIFHEGNIALGGLAGYAIGCLVGVVRYGAPPPPAVAPRAKRGSKHPHGKG